MWGLGLVWGVTTLCTGIHALLAKNSKMVVLQAIRAYTGGAASGPWARRTARDVLGGAV